MYLPSIYSEAHSDTQAQREDYEEAMVRLKRRGCSVKFPVEVADISALTVDGEHAIMPIACEFSFCQSTVTPTDLSCVY